MRRLNVPLGIVVGHRVGESRECDRVSIGQDGSRIEANVSERINLEDSVTNMIHGNRVFGYTGLQSAALVSWCMISRACPNA